MAEAKRHQTNVYIGKTIKGGAMIKNKYTQATLKIWYWKWLLQAMEPTWNKWFISTFEVLLEAYFIVPSYAALR